MPTWFDDHQLAVLAAAMDRVIPDDGVSPGAGGCGAADYVDVLLGAFSFDPPRIFAGGPFSGRAGGEAGFEEWLELGPMEELAWRIRIEGTRGIAEREFNGAVVGLQEQYAAGLPALGDDFAGLDADEQDRRLAEIPMFRALLFGHACEAHYGDPVYGGNRGGAAWSAIGFEGDVQPRGYTDDEVQLP